MRFAHALPKARFVGSRNQSILRICSGKTVLHLGFVDEGILEDRLQQRTWLHEQLSRVSRKLVGVDISVQGVRRALELGYEDCYAGDVENLSGLPFPRLDYDIVLAPDIIEHLANPGLFLSELRKVVTSEMIVVVTTPNALSIKTLFFPLAGTEVVHPDHNFYYSPTTLTTLLKKHGFTVIDVALYSDVWRLNFKNSRSGLDLLLKSLYAPLDFALRYSLVPIFPYFSEGIEILARRQE